MVLRRRADEDDAGRGAGLGEFRALREEAVAGMDGVDLGLLGDPDHLVDRQIGLERPLARADLIGLVRLEAVQRELVLLGIDRDGLDAELGRRAEDADRDLRAVGDEQAAEGRSHGHVGGGSGKCRLDRLMLQCEDARNG